VGVKKRLPNTDQTSNLVNQLNFMNLIKIFKATFPEWHLRKSRGLKVYHRKGLS